MDNARPPPLLALLLMLALLGGCGGGSDGNGGGTTLPVHEAEPQAYTTAYLADNPGLLVQPEHLIVARIDPAVHRTITVPLRVTQPLTVELEAGASATAITHFTIEDDDGQSSAHAGATRTSTTLQPGIYTIVFHAVAASSWRGGSQNIYLKLADTTTHAARRQAMTGAPGAAPTALGAASGNICIGCTFDNMNLHAVDFSGQDLTDSTFVGAQIRATNFSRTTCDRCLFTNIQVIGTPPASFVDASLRNATFSGPGVAFGKVLFSGAILDGATLSGVFEACDFGPSPESKRNTSLRQADLRNARLQSWGTGQMFQGADFSYAQVARGSLQIMPIVGLNTGPSFIGTRLDHLVPSNIFTGTFFKGMDLSGTSFAGMDLSSLDLSAANGVKLSPATDLSGAMLSNGTAGANLSGQSAFAAGYQGFAGNAADPVSGKDLRYVNFTGVNLFQADLTRANLAGAILHGANLSYANLYAASLAGAQLGVAPGSDVVPGNLTGAYLPLADLSDADLRSVNLSGIHAYGSGTRFDRAHMASSSLVGAFLMEASFVQSTMNNADLSSAAAVKAVFDGADLTNAKFSSAYLQGTDFRSVASVQGMSLFNAAVASAAGNWNFREADGTPWVYAYQATKLGLLGTSAATMATCPNGDSAPCNTVAKLTPLKAPPYPPAPACIPAPPRYDNCPPAAH